MVITPVSTMAQIAQLLPPATWYLRNECYLISTRILEQNILSYPAAMSKSLKAFWAKYATPDSFISKIIGRTLTPGSRIFLSDELRVDAGEKIGNKQNVVLQVNSQAKSGALKKWVANNGRGTHGKLAEGAFDTTAADPVAEAERLVADMDAQAKSKVG